MRKIGELIDGRYKILRKLGEGGMSVVYLAVNEKVNKHWAIKEVKKEGVENFETVHQRLLTEADILKRLHHPNLPDIVDIIENEETFLLVMDYIEGRQLESIVQEYGPQKEETVVNWGKQLCDVLSYLHSQNPPIIYRDMKPANVMVQKDGKVVLIDFGTAREFKESQAEDTLCLGTCGYAAPEQYKGQGQSDIRTDIYCLGVTLYYLLTGHNPICKPYEIYPIRYWNTNLSSGLEMIILKCTRKNPSKRYQSCEELQQELSHYYKLDIEYQKSQKIKKLMLFCFLGLTIVSGFLSLVFYREEKELVKNAYEDCLYEAQRQRGKEQYQACYQAAITLNPKDSRAYKALLETFLWKDNEEQEELQGYSVCFFSEKEEKFIREMLGITKEGNKRNEEYLKSRKREYESFAYILGLAYFYSYNGTGNKAAAEKWLKIAGEGKPPQGLQEAEIIRAQKLWKIASYYDWLGMYHQGGDVRISYKDYWGDLTEIVKHEKKNRYKSKDLLFAYKEILSQMITSAFQFARAGVTKAEMEKQLREIEEGLDAMKIEKGSANAVYEEEMKRNLCENLSAAHHSIEAAFEEGSGENE
mgnify:FL=1|jgi:tRNA A-37 threonylcarbamoyl transferase component Bud32